MNLIRARAMGMCFGVRDALATVRSVEIPTKTTIYGELVHNPTVTRELHDRGFASLGEHTRDEQPLPETPVVLVTAHGLSDAERERLRGEGKVLVDTTCPLVRRAHTAARLLQQNGYFVVVIGKPEHVEVRGLVGDLDHYAVVSKPDDVRTFDALRIGVICQTTTPPPEAHAILAAIREKNPKAEIRHVDTICRPTRERQEAAQDLLGQVQCLVVVGGHHSNNTRQLVRLAQQHGKPVTHVENASELDLLWLRQFHTVGLTAGTSTLDETIEEVAQALERL